MKISIQDNLSNLQEYLKDKGYKIYKLSENTVSDVYIYSNSGEGLLEITNKVMGSFEGSFLIDAHNKSFEEIENIINRRVYSPLLME